MARHAEGRPTKAFGTIGGVDGQDVGRRWRYDRAHFSRRGGICKESETKWLGADDLGRPPDAIAGGTIRLGHLGLMDQYPDGCSDLPDIAHVHVVVVGGGLGGC